MESACGLRFCLAISATVWWPSQPQARARGQWRTQAARRIKSDWRRERFMEHLVVLDLAARFYWFVGRRESSIDSDECGGFVSRHRSNTRQNEGAKASNSRNLNCDFTPINTLTYDDSKGLALISNRGTVY